MPSRPFLDHLGYSFIRPDGGGDNVFFHYSETGEVDMNDFEVGTQVSYYATSTVKGPSAVKVEIIPQSS